MQNALLSQMTATTLEAFHGLASESNLLHDQCWEGSERNTEATFFPTKGVFSQVVQSCDECVGLQLIGADGFVGSIMPQMGPSNLRHLTIGTCSGWRLSREDFHFLMNTQPEFEKLCLRYFDVSLNRAAQSAACVKFHSIEQRAAKWLLSSHDLLGASGLIITQQRLANLIGCARPGLNVALVDLQKKGLVTLGRSSISIISVAELKPTSCECHKLQSTFYEKSMGFSLTTFDEAAAA